MSSAYLPHESKLEDDEPVEATLVEPIQKPIAGRARVVERDDARSMLERFVDYTLVEEQVGPTDGRK